MQLFQLQLCRSLVDVAEVLMDSSAGTLSGTLQRWICKESRSSNILNSAGKAEVFRCGKGILQSW